MAEKINNMTIRMDDRQLNRVEDWVERSGCRSRNQFVLQALDFYISYLASKDATSLLAPAIMTALDARLKRLEKSMSESMFRLAVEQDMVNGILADSFRLDDDYLLQLRSDAIHSVKKTNGQLSLERHAKNKSGDTEWQD